MDILVVDDYKMNRELLVSYLGRKGHNVIEAESGSEALEACQSIIPDLILMDIMMPGLNGYETVKAIRDLEKEIRIPIVFVSAIKAEDGMAEAISSGGDDYISKPVNFEILDAKISAHGRVLEINKQLNEAVKGLRLYNQKLYEEQQLVEHIFAHALRNSCLDPRFINYKNRPCEQFDGDVFLAERSPNGDLYVLMGDFTGHGLHAAVGALPVCQTFFAMTRKGLGLKMIISEINKNLQMLFPPNVFMCASVIQVEKDAGILKSWIGGMPVTILHNNKTGEMRSIPSQHMPLGILAENEFDDSIEEVNVSDFEKLYLCSDGIVEARDKDGHEYGIDRLIKKLNEKHDNVFDIIFNDVDAFTEGKQQEDDMTLVEVNCGVLTALID
ncbi:MAG: fused response regulator/phosphatase [Gammaproteobacteria bacterium]|nr:fused response regulator/phosphatase [Gammaproteobacteria bacterium]MCW9003737.1 fused response regulator/phosphatase [Gammaproteobacteria bacterium]MCW9055158.1 fused response regulator/phosphatase [Gammaproteobacteria bacterium]